MHIILVIRKERRKVLLIDKYAYTNKLKDFNPMAKFCFAMGILILSLINVKIYTFMFIIGSMLAITIGAAGIPLGKYIKMLLIPSVFLIISLITILISFSKDSSIFVCSTKLGSIYLGIAEGSISQVSILFFRALSCITATYFLALTVPMNQQILVLKKLKVPKVVIEMMILIYRFIFIFLEEYKEIYTAQSLRFGYTSVKKSYKSLSLLISILFIRVMKRYKDMTISLDSKLFNGEFYM